ncbi:uncharacterized protein LOC117398830 [Acipenser ruthenus]|uniref:uncharacterized protein LOC117398830 n=2 Tax=Acipenser ruthenus TaxID=7906 RepID=UPI002742647B|nr:uncharacterized protein LOC117398830 [Acipenser ruthenus]
MKMDGLSFYQKQFLQAVYPNQITSETDLPCLDGTEKLRNAKTPEDIKTDGTVLGELILEEEFTLSPKLWASRDWRAFKKVLLEKQNGIEARKRVDVFDIQLGDSGECKAMVVGYREAVLQVRREISEFLESQVPTKELVPFGVAKDRLLRLFNEKLNLEVVGLKYKRQKLGIEISGTKNNVARALEVIDRVTKRVSQTNHSRNVPIQIYRCFQTFEGMNIFICLGDDIESLQSESIIQEGARLGDLQLEVLDERPEVTLAAHKRLTGQGKLQSVITLHWGNSSTICESDSAALLESSITLALEYLESHGLQSVAMCCPLARGQCVPGEPEVLVSALEMFCRKRSFYISHPLSVFLVCHKESACKLERSLGLRWPLPPQSGLDVRERILTKLVCGDLEENKSAVLVLAVTVSEETHNIQCSQFIPHTPSKALEAVLELQSVDLSLRSTLRRGEAVLVPCLVEGLLPCQYLYLVDIEEDLKDPAEVLRSLVDQCLRLCQGSLLSSVVFPVLDLLRFGVGVSQTVGWLEEGVRRFEREHPSPRLESVSLLLNLDPMDLHTVVNDIEGPSEIFGTCFTDDPYFIQYLKDAGEGLKEMTSKLLVAGLKIRLSRHTHGPCFLVTPNPSSHHTSEQWIRSLGDTYNTERRRYSVRYDQLSNWISKPSCAPTLKEVGSIAVYGEGEVVVGLNEEVEELYQAMGFYQEAVKECCSKLWSPNTALMVFGALQEQLASQFPEVLASPSVDPMMSHSWFIFEGPREDVTLAMEFFHQETSDSLISVTIDEKLLGYQSVFLGELDLEALTIELFQSRGISATLQHREASVVMYAQPLEETGRAINVLKEILQETGIRINQANLAATKDENWEDFLDEVYSRLNNGGQKKLNFYNLLNDNGDTDLVVLVGFRTEVQAAQRLISHYLHNKSQTRRTLTFRQEHLVQAGSQLLEIMEWETSINVKVEVRVAGGSWLEVTLCGSREQVKWAQPFIKKDLEALIQKTVRITEPGAVRFFQEETGTQLLKETGMREQCLILLREETAEGFTTTQNESPEREMRPEAAVLHHQDAAELLLIGRLEGVESAAASVQSHFQSTQTLQCLRDPRLCELTPEQLQEVQSRLGVRLRLSEGALTIQGPQDHVTQAKTHIEWLLVEVLHQLSNYLSGYLTSCEILKKFQQWELQQSPNTQQEERMELEENELPESDEEVEEQQGDQREEKQAFSWLSSYLSGIFTSAKLLDAQPFPCSVSDCPSDASWTETEELKELEQSPGLQLNMNTELQETRAPSTTSQQGSQSIDKKQPSLPAAKPAYQLTDKNTVLSEKPLPTRVNETRAPSTASQQGSQYIEKNTHHPSLPTIEPAYQLTEKNTVLREKPLPTRVNETRAPSTTSQQGSQSIDKKQPSLPAAKPAYQLTDKNTVLSEKPLPTRVNETRAPSTASQQGSQYIEKNTHHPSLPTIEPAYQLTEKNTVLREKPLPTRVNETRAPSTASQQGSQFIDTKHPSPPTMGPAFMLTKNRAPSTASQQGSQYIEKKTHHPSHLTMEPAYQLTEKKTVLKEKLVSATVKKNRAPSTASQQGSQYIEENTHHPSHLTMEPAYQLTEKKTVLKEKPVSATVKKNRAPSTASQQGSQYIEENTHHPSHLTMEPAYQLTEKKTVLKEKPVSATVKKNRAPSTASQQGSQYIEENTHHPSLPTIEPAYQLTEKNTVLREKPLPTRVNETRAPSTASQQGSQYIEENTHHPSLPTIEPAYQLTEKNAVLKENPVSATVKENRAPSTASQQGSQYNQPTNCLPNSGHALVSGFAVPSCSFLYTQPALKPAAQSFRCSVCDRHFDTKQGLSSHFTQMHTPEGRSTCPDCGKNSTKSGITRHKCQGKTGTGESKESRPLSCKRELKLSPDCQFNMNTEFGVISTPSTKTQTQFQSNQSTDWDMLSYLNRDDAHLSGILAIAKDLDAAHWSSSFTQPALKPAVQSFLCSLCCRSFGSQQGLSLHHTLMHSSAGRATCPFCGMESTKGGITRHKCKGR